MCNGNVIGLLLIDVPLLQTNQTKTSSDVAKAMYVYFFLAAWCCVAKSIARPVVSHNAKCDAFFRSFDTHGIVSKITGRKVFPLEWPVGAPDWALRFTFHMYVDRLDLGRRLYGALLLNWSAHRFHLGALSVTVP